METLSGIQSLKNNRSENRRLIHFQTKLEENINAVFERQRFENRFEMLLRFLRAGEQGLILFVLATQVVKQEISLGMMYAFTVYRGMLESRYESVIADIGIHLNLKAHVDQVQDIFQIEPENNTPVTALRVRTPGELVFESVCLSYDAGRNYLLTDFSETIKSGEFVAIIGESGSGKTTLLNSVLGLHSPVFGKVLFDN